MKTLIVCIMAAIVASSNAFWFKPAPEEFVHHHHHHHEVLHKSFAALPHPVALPNFAPHAVEIHAPKIHIIKVLHEHVPEQHQLGYGIEHGHGLVVQPILNKNFIHSQHEHHYHQVPLAPVHHHGWD